ncbi:MAG TPA: transglycosylase SLT domain-containing protein [Pyrinomonadaceae bacterium]|nr:transglycosylase SLT domain-containing protein [Pyrinomonadaceae bacterium]
MITDFRQHRVTLIIIGIVVVLGALIAPFTFMSASCSTRPQTVAEDSALDQLRAMTRNGVLPSEGAVAQIESAFPNSKVAGIARMIRARIHLKNNDASGAAQLLDSAVIRERTELGDYALYMRAQALEQMGRRGEARSAYEQLSSDYPNSLRERDAKLHTAQIALQDNQPSAVSTLLREAAARDDAAALLLTAKAFEQTSDSTRALASYRRIYFFAPASSEAADAEAAITRLNSTPAPATTEEAITRAEKLFEAKRYDAALSAYSAAFERFPNTSNAQMQLHRGISAFNAKRTPDAVAALTSVPTGAGETRAEALYYLAQTYARAKQWAQAHSTTDEMRRLFPQSNWTPRAIVAAGQIARDAKNDTDALSFFRSAVSAYPGNADVAQAQFEIAWAAHEAKNYQESSRLLVEHLADYAGKNTDNRGRAGYWAARDTERVGKLAEARAIYQAMQSRYSANWYGYLSKQRLDVMNRNGTASQSNFAPDSLIGRAVQNLQTVSFAEENAGQREDERITKADQLSNIGANDWALEELNAASQSAPNSPRINLAMARIYRLSEDNLQAFNIMKRSYPDYAQMRVEELTSEEWDIFYPLSYWDIITQESRARNLDPYQVAGLIRQESVFNPRARSNANAYGLMQLLVPTGRLTALKYGVNRDITIESLYEPRLNIQLGTAYFRDQLDKYGRIEYVAAAYNAGPARVVQWRTSLPSDLDDWVEAIPFRETRGYVQGVVRNTLQYRRIYDEQGHFRPEVGTRAVNTPRPSNAPAVQPANQNTRPRRVSGEEEED